MRMLRLSFLLPLLWMATPSLAQTARVVATCGTTSQTYPVGVDRPITVDTNGRLCGLDTATPGTGWPIGATGAAVPSVADYLGINIGGNLTGITGFALGSQRVPGVAIVDAAGAQITSFGTAGTQSNASSGVATSSTNQASVAWMYGFNGTTWDQVAIKAASTAPVATDKAIVTSLSPNSAGIITLGQATKANSVPVTIASDQGSIGALSSQYPSGAAAITASQTGTTGATTATLAGASSKTTYICGFTITSDATAALAGVATVTGTITGTLNYIQNVGGATAAGILTQTFSPCIPASATNTGIATNSVAAGTGGATAVTAWGYQL